jgi:hypothetical protein
MKADPTIPSKFADTNESANARATFKKIKTFNLQVEA